MLAGAVFLYVYLVGVYKRYIKLAFTVVAAYVECKLVK